MPQPAVKYDSSEFVKFYKALAQVDPDLKKALRKRLMVMAKPVVSDVKQAALSIPSSRETGGTRKKKGATLGLRASLAAAAKVDFNGTRPGAVLHIRISTTRFMAVSGRPRTLPYYMEKRRKRPWRHPVFGNSDVWVQQEGHAFLMPTVIQHKPKFINEVKNAVDDALNQISNKVN